MPKLTKTHASRPDPAMPATGTASPPLNVPGPGQAFQFPNLIALFKDPLCRCENFCSGPPISATRSR